MNARKHSALAAVFASVALFGGPDARCQEAKPEPTKPDAAKPSPTPQQRVARTTELVGIAVTGTAGEKIGELSDLVLDDEHDCVAFAIVATGGGKLLPIPFAALRHVEGTSGGRAMRMATPDLTKAPTFDSKSWPDFDRAYAERVYDFYKAQPYWKGRSERPAARSTTLRATAVIGQNVKDPRDETVGELFDVVIDEGSGRVAYAILSAGGFLGVGERLMALPWATLEPPKVDGKPRILDATAEQIEKAPSFDRKSWPDLADRKIGTELHRYWNQKPYWEARAQTRADNPDRFRIRDSDR